MNPTTLIKMNTTYFSQLVFNHVSNNEYKELEELIDILSGSEWKDYILNYQDEEGDTPLMVAIKNRYGECIGNKEECVDILIKAGVNQSLRNKRGYSPIMRAASIGYLNCLKKLNITSENVNWQCTTSHDTALIVAAFNGMHNTVEYLLKVDADPSIRNTAGKTALDYAVEKNNKCVKFLEEVKSAPPIPVPIQNNHLLIQSLCNTINAQTDLIQKLNDKLDKRPTSCCCYTCQECPKEKDI